MLTIPKLTTPLHIGLAAIFVLLFAVGGKFALASRRPQRLFVCFDPK
ncbi:hypothetical protein OP10G_1633 [Fimbriimonas ginsengisoli Gsoil 348]|uniref:Uncharacterized protein n=1 Tax=Fimbriimonas ginsengisoli Gsoil 348 TaxID=661478 RepID=A0A068NNG7_FIMGI|nr:hypothetical protein OP10G_1633 [Fimbriimonas ginsengisoli Gsoil 348]